MPRMRSSRSMPSTTFRPWNFVRRAAASRVTWCVGGGVVGWLIGGGGGPHPIPSSQAKEGHLIHFIYPFSVCTCGSATTDKYTHKMGHHTAYLLQLTNPFTHRITRTKHRGITHDAAFLFVHIHTQRHIYFIPFFFHLRLGHDPAEVRVVDADVDRGDGHGPPVVVHRHLVLVAVGWGLGVGTGRVGFLVGCRRLGVGGVIIVMCVERRRRPAQSNSQVTTEPTEPINPIHHYQPQTQHHHARQSTHLTHRPHPSPTPQTTKRTTTPR